MAKIYNIIFKNIKVDIFPELSTESCQKELPIHFLYVFLKN